MKDFQIRQLVATLKAYSDVTKEDAIGILHNDILPLVTEETDFGYEVRLRARVDEEGVMIGDAFFRWDRIYTEEEVSQELQIFSE